MPNSRTLLVIPLALALFGLPTASSPLAAAPATDVTLPLLVTRGKAPAAALLTREDPWPPAAPGQPEPQAAQQPDQRPRWHFTQTYKALITRTDNNSTDTSAETGTGAGATDTSGGTASATGSTPGIRRTDHFRAGSITKTFIATVVLQLAAERRLSLSDPVERHLPGLIRGENDTDDTDLDGRTLTLHALLTHTSGLADYTAGTKGLIPVTPLEAVRTALALPATTPGRWSYSNTNYVVLGMVIKQVTGNAYATEATRRIITPLGLSGTSFPGARTTLPSPHGRAYTSEGEDVTALNPRVAGAAGELISTLADLDRFYAALLGGRLLPATQLRQMLNTRAAQGRYGMGLYPQKLPCGTTVWGHNGHIAGSYVRTAATRDGDRVLTFRVNTDGIADPTLERTLLSAEFCT
ncbi:beta-lactamase family protein [Streptomyces sp. NBC_01381]|uniref:serine hydrolase domain-containing protein n=1 Tax=Streptomyces sp. NBC_01381 TaxID=2903845 RepID=UPI00225189BF|nr:serine hydrolase domain-containing protein [Streptomyces sp. NBC_01381]MCX4669316.1 beta-lactamase family protein [Streptomyces sp. NBC_01381]